MFETWQEWHEYMKGIGAVSTVEKRSFLLEGGCPKCGCKSWNVTSDGWAYCNGCGYGQSQDFEVNQRTYVVDICPDHPHGCPDVSYEECREKYRDHNK